MQRQFNHDNPSPLPGMLFPPGLNQTGATLPTAPALPSLLQPVNQLVGHPHVSPIGLRPIMSVYPPPLLPFDGRSPVICFLPPPIPIAQFFPPAPLFPYPYMTYPYASVPPMTPYSQQEPARVKVNDWAGINNPSVVKQDVQDTQSTNQATPSSPRISETNAAPEHHRSFGNTSDPNTVSTTGPSMLFKRSEPSTTSFTTALIHCPEEPEPPSDGTLETQIHRIRNFWKGSNYSYPHILKRVKVVRHRLTDEVETCEVLDFSGKGLYTNNNCEEKFFTTI
jgi:hypothetical protein